MLPETREQQIDLVAQRYVYWLDKYAADNDPQAWAMVLKILEQATRKGWASQVVDRATVLIMAETQVNTGVQVVTVL